MQAAMHLIVSLCMQQERGTQRSYAVGLSSHLISWSGPYFLLDLGDFKQKEGVLRAIIFKK